MANPMIPLPADVLAPPTAPVATPPAPNGAAPNGAAPADVAALAPEIAFLKQHGMEAEAQELGAQLESILKAAQNGAGDPASQGLPTAAPITQPSAPQAPAAQQTALEKALDPLAPEGANQTTTEGSDGELVEGIVIDANGRPRDAQTGQYVPLKALHRERDKVKDLRSELQQQREMNARVEERLAVLNELLASGGELPQAQQQQQPAAPDPLAPPSLDELVDPDVDIFKSAKQMQDYLKKYADYAARLKAELDNAVEAKIKPTQQQIQEMSVSQAIQRDLTSFVAKNPDLPDAYKHLRKARADGLKVVGFGSDEEITAYLNNEEKVLQQRSLAQNKSFAQAVYDLAKTYGYQKQAEPAPTPEATPAPVAAQQAPAAPQAQAPAVDPAAAAKVQALAAAQQQAGATLNGHGGTPAEGLTVQQLVNMNDAQFLDLAAKLGKASGGTGSGLRKLDELLRGL